jgi:hypothetical protein
MALIDRQNGAVVVLAERTVDHVLGHIRQTVLLQPEAAAHEARHGAPLHGLISLARRRRHRDRVDRLGEDLKRADGADLLAFHVLQARERLRALQVEWRFGHVAEHHGPGLLHLLPALRAVEQHRLRERRRESAYIALYGSVVVEHVVGTPLVRKDGTGDVGGIHESVLHAREGGPNVDQLSVVLGDETQASFRLLGHLLEEGVGGDCGGPVLGGPAAVGDLRLCSGGADQAGRNEGGCRKRLDRSHCLLPPFSAVLQFFILVNI